MNINQVVTDSELQDLKQRYRFDRTVTRILEALECERAGEGEREKLRLRVAELE